MKKKRSNFYFTNETQEKILEYNNLDEIKDKKQREDIYTIHIHPALNKLCENVINKYKLKNIQEPFDHLKHELILMLTESLHKYKKSNGKAFSYFTVIARNYLYVKYSKYIKEQTKMVYFDHLEHDDDELKYSFNPIDSEDEGVNELIEFIPIFLNYLENNKIIITKNKKELEILNALIEIIKYREHVNIFNKKALYIMIREQTSNSTQTITKTLNKVKNHFYRKYNEFLINGNIVQGIKK